MVLKTGCVVMAAGNARRFGKNKLAAGAGGRSLIRRALEAIPGEALEQVAVVTQYPEILKLAEAFRFSAVFQARSVGTHHDASDSEICQHRADAS